jgi:uncharacterized protein YrzB (UPF0473 family)
MLNDNTPDIYTLEDEEGNEAEYELLDTMTVDGIKYFALVSTDTLNDDGELIVLKEDNGAGENMLVTIDDEEELDRIGNIFLDQINAMYEGADDEDSADGAEDGSED